MIHQYSLTESPFGTPGAILQQWPEEFRMMDSPNFFSQSEPTILMLVSYQKNSHLHSSLYLIPQTAERDCGDSGVGEDTQGTSEGLWAQSGAPDEDKVYTGARHFCERKHSQDRHQLLFGNEKGLPHGP